MKVAGIPEEEEEGRATSRCVGRTHSDQGFDSSQEVVWGKVLTSAGVGREDCQVTGSRGKTG